MSALLHGPSKNQCGDLTVALTKAFGLGFEHSFFAFTFTAFISEL